ncbi:TM0106 family RecB-like putative nuclease [Thermocrispum municipale]|jgi:predicted RecB family nuclease|uniref:TM0106 family RecB-like putative nuclease n=1 Tax=Thermocrispum municipale TaxID=37926 RepID=UPI00048AFFAE|nr:TM0106 family RecB-like putative nuclease [Thermocrispum municipale]
MSLANVVLDAGVVTRCRRRVHWEHDPAAPQLDPLPENPAVEQRKADAQAHRAAIAKLLAEEFRGSGWVEVPTDAEPEERIAATVAALQQGVSVISGGLLPVDVEAGRRGGAELLVRTPGGYVPVIVVRHRITDPGEGALTTALTDLNPDNAREDPERKVRSHPRDQFRLAHVVELLRAAGYADPDRVVGGVIGLDADVVLWHDLLAPSFPGEKSTMQEYAERFADRLAVAAAAASGAEPLAQPSRILACRHCPWWPVCEKMLHDKQDVSLVVRGDDAVALREAGFETVASLAAADPKAEPPIAFTGTTFENAVALARAWQAGLSVVRLVPRIEVPRGDVEVDVDMESYVDHGAYLWGTLLSGADIGLPQTYRAFGTWEPLPTEDEARSFAEFWAWFTDVRSRAAARGLTFRAYCYNAWAENRWLLGSAERFAGMPGIPSVAEVQEFIDSDEWVDMFVCVVDSFLCAHGKGLKVIARVAGYEWHDPDAGGEASMRWYREAVGLGEGEADPAQRARLLRYNEDDVRATFVLREWMTSTANTEIPYVGDL